MTKYLLLTLVVTGVFGIWFTAFADGVVTKGTGKKETAIFAGGCFWCMEPQFEKLEGVISVESGYTGGTMKNPTYEDVSSGKTGHAEAVRILFDPEKILFKDLLEVFWRSINPVQKNGQFADIGTQYRTAIFYMDDAQKQVAMESKIRMEKSGKFNEPIAVQIVPASEFFPAEEYHQNYYKKHPFRYKSYKYGSGRQPYLDRVWKDE